MHAAKVGTDNRSINLRSFLIHWRSLQFHNEAQILLFQILPIYSCWNLWKKRCAVKYGGKKSSIRRVQYVIFKDNIQVLTVAFPSLTWQPSWEYLINLIELCQQQFKVTKVCWEKPGIGIFKLNTNGSAIHNPGKIVGEWNFKR